MKIISLNVRGISSIFCKEKRQTLFFWAKENKIDILCLQETFCTNLNVHNINNEWDGLAFHALSDSPHGRGVSILFRSDLDIDILDHKFSIDGRRLLVNFNYQSQKYCIVNTYAPNNESARIDFLKDFVHGFYKILVMS